MISGRTAWFLKLGVSAAAVIAASGTAHAQAAVQADPSPSQASEVVQDAEVGAEADEILVTGSRIERAGFDAPTPVAVIGEDLLVGRAPLDVVDALAALPQFRNTLTSQSANQVATGGGGQSMINLRGLGFTSSANRVAPRTLVLLNGQRIMPTTPDGIVDIGVLPQILLKRIDVVTGGVSAVYGSDAVAGVANFILDTKLSELKATVTSGVSDKGDGSSNNLSLAWGGKLGENFHVVAGGTYYRSSGVPEGSRDFQKSNVYIFTDPATGKRTFRDNVYYYGSNFNGVMLNTAMAGTEFLSDGTTRKYDLNTCTRSGSYIACPTPQNFGNFTEDTIIAAPRERYSGYARVEGDITSDVNVYADVLYGRDKVTFNTIPYVTGAHGVLTLSRANAFLPAATRTEMTTRGITSFQLGRYSKDFGATRGIRETEMQRYSTGFAARLSDNWKLAGYYSYGTTDYYSAFENSIVRTRLTNAVDSILVGNVPACRINTDATTANDDAACVPINLFGNGSVTKEALDYITDTAWSKSRLQQHVGSLAISGDLFSTWAGPVSVAAGAEYRRESISQAVDAIGAIRGYTGANPSAAFSGAVEVKDVFAEAVVPLASGGSLAETLELNLAGRLTDYSTSGSVATWKAGLNYVPVHGIRFRGTVSRDIRAPTLFELYANGRSASQVISDPKNGNQTFTISGHLDNGNSALRPEIATTWTGGVVFEPRGIPNLSVSADYYNIRVRDAIGSPTAQEITTRCAAGDQALCTLLTRTNADGSTTDGSGSGTPTRVVVQSMNLSLMETVGVDVEARYFFRLAGGRLTLRAGVNYLDKFDITLNGVTAHRAGDAIYGLSRWAGNAGIIYYNNGWGLGIDGQYKGGGKYDATLDFEGNKIPAVTYFNATLSHKVKQAGQQEMVFFLNVKNIFDKAPPRGFEYYLGGYDRIGRTYVAGVRLTGF